jgi:hypothetical protein
MVSNLRLIESTSGGLLGTACVQNIFFSPKQRSRCPYGDIISRNSFREISSGLAGHSAYRNASVSERFPERRDEVSDKLKPILRLNEISACVMVLPMMSALSQ